MKYFIMGILFIFANTSFAEKLSKGIQDVEKIIKLENNIFKIIIFNKPVKFNFYRFILVL